MKDAEVPVARRQRLRADDRRAQIVRTAFDMIAETGLERFRTRDVATRVGINPATLHHYFATKEDLILSVGEHLEAGFVQERAESGRRPAARKPLQALRRELTEAANLRAERSSSRAVAREFATRAPRDPAAAAVMHRLTTGWRGVIEATLKEGVALGVFRPDLDPRGAGVLFVSALWAATTFLPLSDDEFRGLCRELERLVVKP